MIYKTHNLKEFYSEIIKMDEVQSVITEKYGPVRCQQIVQKFSEGIHHDNIPDDIEQIIIDLVEINYDIDETLTGIGGYGAYPIEIKSFGPVFWIDAQEFDPIGYFKSSEDAITCAESYFETKD